MKVFNKEQERELKKISEYLTSKDNEIVKLGIQLLRKSNTYRQLKPLSLFYYVSGVSAITGRVRVSTYINRTVRDILYFKSGYSRRVSTARLRKMFEHLLDENVRSYFNREFFNTSKII